MKILQTWFRSESRWWPAAILAATLVVGARQIHVGGFSWSEAPRHAMDGAFVLDLVRAHPVGHVGQWTRNYLAKYPGVGIIVFDPPFFAAVEAAFYAGLGVSVAAARACVLGFALAGVLAMYWVARQLFDRTAGLLAAGLWASLPATVLWSRQVMLEVPATTMLLITAGSYLQYKSGRSRVWLVFTALSLAAAVLTWPGALGFGVVLLADLVLTLKLRRALTREHTLAAGATLIVVGAYLAVAAEYASLGQFLVGGGVAWRHLISLHHWLFYLHALPDVLSWPMLGFAAVGFLMAAVTGQLKKLRLPLLWLVLFYLLASVIAYKETRYLYPVTPAGVLLAVGGLGVGLEKTKVKSAGGLILALVMVFQFINGWRQNPDRLSSYDPAARLIQTEGDGRLVLVDAVRDGQFIFDLRRRQGPDGPVYTLRGSNVLYSLGDRRPEQCKAYVHRESEILDLIRTYGIRYIVVESTPPDTPNWPEVFPPPSQLLRKVLRNTNAFEKLATYSIGANRVWNGVDLEVYRYRGRIASANGTLTIPMPATGKDLEITGPIP